MEIKASVSLEPIRVTAQVKAPTVNIKDGMSSGQVDKRQSRPPGRGAGH
ncbi:hypothetical protein [uncultured Acidaminococcus sp.]|nr:hypothetical protein [uncultured Acidaminococcus sp.]